MARFNDNLSVEINKSPSRISYASINKKPRRHSPAGFAKSNSILTLAVLESLASAGLAVFLALFHARIARQQTFRFQLRAQVRIRRDQRASNSVTHRASLPARTATGYVDK